MLPKPRSLAAGPRSVRGAEAGTAACEVPDNWIRQAAAAARDASRAVSRALEEPVLRQARVRTESRARAKGSLSPRRPDAAGALAGGGGVPVCLRRLCMHEWLPCACTRKARARAHAHARTRAHTHTHTRVCARRGTHLTARHQLDLLSNLACLLFHKL